MKLGGPFDKGRAGVTCVSNAKKGNAVRAKLLWGWAVVAALGISAPVKAQETIKIAFIDPLSGGGASTGEAGLKTYQFIADQLNAKGGVLGKRVEIVGYDNKLNPQESLVQVQTAVDAGIRIITQGNGSGVAAAIIDFIAKVNEPHPRTEIP